MWMVAAAAIIGGTTAVYAQKADTPAQKPDGTKIYVMPDDVRCYVLKKDQTTYCTDLQGAPITGELRKYRDNELIRTYQLIEQTFKLFFAQTGSRSQFCDGNGRHDE